ncbi:aminopeptidase KNAG_0L01730 [Huiozyma naganishii CBS 8797]|uniref:Aminopeptidase P N-terminal domain-containing protein n=1 Tax=Huiozyma naganishii (strain ATCC MYA-139 / BCRC 22969 / CBS 8797 / KCTC 17520 / NBRC 10181 / NCYC 3082 / Yp74L-3) TaxID=1071383 RepID=J7RSA6_HUIN7|nr:hypothetical protein KNAG_0L01730 [Kazachstania naganishii CBS 8797]CCK72793.1 hypothetical protein KNAG_0L01730 [Kazachstania naganishii CBS 8797]
MLSRRLLPLVYRSSATATVGRLLHTGTVTLQNNSRIFFNRERLLHEAGQPIHETRPNLIKSGDLTLGITAIEYHTRRAQLISQVPKGSCIIIPSGTVKFASGAVFYPFQQDNDFYYLSGWNEPNSLIVLEKTSDSEFQFTMFVPPKDNFAEKWEGFRTGVDGAMEIFNVDKAFSINSVDHMLPKILKRCSNIWFDEQNPNLNAKVKKLIDANCNPLKVVKNHKRLLAQLRKIKSPAELNVMRRAGQISGRSYNQAFAKRFRNERSLASFLEYKFISGGCDKNAYIPVVATGSNALCIHYTRNDDIMYEDEMVLVDAAGSLGGYRSDISRTWPVSGTFTQPQRDMYQAVLNVQRRCIELCKESNGLSLNDIHEKSIEYMKQEIRNLGMSNASNWDVERLYPHYIGHNLGLDVHDVPEVSRRELLKQGQVITIEPGLYIPDDASFPAHFRNLGIRIEDDIAVGKETYTNLTVEAVKEIDDLENIMSNGKTLTPFEDDVVSPLALE